jgi:hypothetical protein
LSVAERVPDGELWQADFSITEKLLKPIVLIRKSGNILGRNLIDSKEALAMEEELRL